MNEQELSRKLAGLICYWDEGATSGMSIYAFLLAEWLKVMWEKAEPAPALCLAIEKLIDKEVTK